MSSSKFPGVQYVTIPVESYSFTDDRSDKIYVILRMDQIGGVEALDLLPQAFYGRRGARTLTRTLVAEDPVKKAAQKLKKGYHKAGFYDTVNGSNKIQIFSFISEILGSNVSTHISVDGYVSGTPQHLRIPSSVFFGGPGRPPFPSDSPQPIEAWDHGDW